MNIQKSIINEDINKDQTDIIDEKEKGGDENISLKNYENKKENVDHDYENVIESNRGKRRSVKSKNKNENEKKGKTKDELYDDISEIKLQEGSVCRSTKDIDEDNYNNEETKNIKDEFLVDKKNEEEGYDDDTYTSERDKSMNEKIMKEEYINKDDTLEKNDNIINIPNKKSRLIKKTTTKKRITRVSEESTTKVDTRESDEDDLMENEQWTDSKKICVIKNNSPHND